MIDPADLNLLTELVMTPGVSGFEAPIRARIRRELPAGTVARADAAGNLLTVWGPATGGPCMLVVAHMDELGLVTTQVEATGWVRFRKMGTIDDRTLLGRRVRVWCDDGPRDGCILAQPASPVAERVVAPSRLMMIDVGAGSAAASGVRRLQPVTFVKEIAVLNGRRLVGRGIDDRFGCLLLLQLARQFATTPPAFPVTLAWSTQEEIGFGGARLLANTGRWDAVIAVDVFAAADGFGASGPLARVRLGAGPVARLVDHGAIASPRLARWVFERAAAAGVALQVAPTGGETDGKVLQTAATHMVALSIPIRYLHSQAEMVDLADLAQLAQLLAELTRVTPPFP